MNYGVGDTVVCIDAMPKNEGRQTALVAGARYLVRGMRNNPCCGFSTIDVGVFASTRVRCGGCDALRYADGYRAAWRFIKLDGLKEDQTVEDEITV